MLYSINNNRPSPLPYRIRMPDGFTRTNPSTFTEEEIRAAGYTGPYVEPSYNPETEQLIWENGSYIVEPLPPPLPTPDWFLFKTSMLTNADVNSAMGAAMPYAPLAVMSLPTALNTAVLGDTNDFTVTWTTLRQANLIPQLVIDTVIETAISCNLPQDFISTLSD